MPIASGVKPKMRSSAILSSIVLLLLQSQDGRGIADNPWLRRGIIRIGGKRRLTRPALGSFLVGFLGVDPAAYRAVCTMFLLPERRARLQVIHQKARRFEGRMPMR